MDAVAVVVAVGALLGNAAAAAWLFESASPTAAALRRTTGRPSSWVAAGLVALIGVCIVVPWVYAETSADAPDELSFDDAPPVSTTALPRSTLPPVTRPGTGAATSTSRTSLVIANPSITAPPATAPIGDGRQGGRGSGGTGGRGSGGTATPEEPTATTVDPALTGTWQIGPGSIAGYRVDEVLLFQHKATAGRTQAVTGTMVIDGLTVQSVAVTVDMASVKSGDGQRDAEFRGRLLDVARYPTATFLLTAPIPLDGVPAEGEVVEREATGDFTIRGVTRTVTFPVQARRNGGRIEVLASVPVRWSDYRIPDPSTPLTQVEDHGTIELLLLFDRP